MSNGKLLQQAFKFASGHLGEISTMLSTKRISYSKVQAAADDFERAAKILREIR